jgi:solute carrier family 13 (sodium-dependent dicarboxylate transporter), member 2/3/5
MTPAHLTFLILALMAAGFLSQRMPPYVIGLLGALVLAATGVLPMADLFTGFANPTLILFAGMFVIGDAIFRTGLANAVGDWAVRRMGHSERRLLWGTMIVSAALSTVASNTATTAALIPLVLSVCIKADLSASRLLMPMAFTSGFGGISALIGTPPNMIVSDALRGAGAAPFGFFEFAWVGIPVALAGMAYMDLIGRRLLPKAPTPAPRAFTTNALPLPRSPASMPAGFPTGPTSPAPLAEAQRPEAQRTEAQRRRMWICGGILGVVVVVMALNLSWLPLEFVAVACALACVLTGCVTGKEAVDSVEWETIILFGSMFAVAIAMDKSGASAIIAEGLLGISGLSRNPHAVVAGVMALTMFLGLFLSNTACAVLLAPIGLSLAKGIGANPQPILMAIAVAASCSFLTPVSTPPNLLVWEPGKYRFMDYVKVGSGLGLICAVVAVVIIPWKWPVFPP